MLRQPWHALWLLPSPVFRRAAFASRGGLWRIAGSTSDPEVALDNLLARDRMFTERVGEAVAAMGLHSIAVDSATTHPELQAKVEERFGLSTDLYGRPVVVVSRTVGRVFDGLFNAMG